MQKPEKGFREIDFRVAVTVGVLVLVHILLSKIWSNLGDYVNLCIMAICGAFLGDVNLKTSWKSGVSRIVVTFIGAIIALIPVALYSVTHSEVLTLVVFTLCAVCALVIAKSTGLMYVQCRLSLVSYILTVYVFHGEFYEKLGQTGFNYCLMWVLSTLLGVAVSLLVAVIWDFVRGLIVKEKVAK
jgi:hypothetical protein